MKAGFQSALFAAAGTLDRSYVSTRRATSITVSPPSLRPMNGLCHTTVTIGSFASFVSDTFSLIPALGDHLLCAYSAGINSQPLVFIHRRPRHCSLLQLSAERLS